MTKQVIAVDIDDTVFQHFYDMKNWYNKVYGTSLTLADNHPTSTENWGTKTVEEAVKRVHRFYETSEFKEAKPYSEAIEVLEEISQIYKIFFVTSRDELLEEFTHEWLEKHFKGVYEEVHFAATYSLTGRAKSKLEICQNINAEFIIDDVISTCINIAEAGITAILFGDYPWNQNDGLPPGVIHCKDWPEVREYFGEKSRI